MNWGKIGKKWSWPIDYYTCICLEVKNTKISLYVGYEVLAAVVMKIWNIAPCSLLKKSTDVSEEHIASVFMVE
jgi:hypothetical protein